MDSINYGFFNYKRLRYLSPASLSVFSLIQLIVIYYTVSFLLRWFNSQWWIHHTYILSKKDIFFILFSNKICYVITIHLLYIVTMWHINIEYIHYILSYIIILLWTFGWNNNKLLMMKRRHNFISSTKSDWRKPVIINVFY